MNDGKPFEDRVKHNLIANGVCCHRLPDQMSGRVGSKNPCDFIAYKFPNEYYLECKSCSAVSFDMLSYITEYQWIELRKKDMFPGIRAGYLIWMSAYSKLFWVSAFAADVYYKSGIKHLSIPDFERIGISIPATQNRDTWIYADIIDTIR